MPIRPLALAIMWREDSILVMEGHDHIKNETFYRPLGGGIEFGEPSPISLKREFQEELNAEIVIEGYLATFENIFTLEGQMGHEIVLVHAAHFVDDRFYQADEITMVEEEGEGRALWIPLSAFADEGLRLYPDNLYDLLITLRETGK